MLRLDLQFFASSQKKSTSKKAKAKTTAKKTVSPVKAGTKAGKQAKGTGKTINGFEAKVHPGKQGKHIPGHSNYQEGKSIFTGNAQKLLDKYAGKGEWIGQNKERVDFKQVIGKWVDPTTGKAYETTKGIIHYSKNGAHIVPARP